MSKICPVSDMMGLRQEWLCRGEVKAKGKSNLENGVVNPCDSSFFLTFWEAGTVSGVRVKSLPDVPGLMRQGRKGWEMLVSKVAEEVGAWDVAGEWDSNKILLRLLPRKGGSPVLLRGQWGLRAGLVTSVQLEFNSSRMKQGLELVREDLVEEADGQMQMVRESLNQLHNYFGSSKLSGFDDLTVVAGDGRLELQTSRLVFLSQSEYFKALLRQEPLTKRVDLSCGGKVLQIILDFLLTGNLDIDPDEVQEVMEMADFLGIADLLDSCERAIAAAIDLENCLQVWALGHQLNRQGLVKQAELFLLRNLQGVLSFKAQSLAMSPTLLNRILLDSQLCVFGENGAQVWGLERLETLRVLVDQWEGWQWAAGQVRGEVLLPLGPDQVQEYIVEKSRAIGRSVRFCGIGVPKVVQPFTFLGGGEVGGFTLAWRRTNFSLPVLAGLSLHWATGLTDSVGQVEEDDEIELEKCKVKMGEHFTAVIGADHHCIQQLNFLTSKGRILGPQLLESGQSSLASLLPNVRDPSMVGMVGTCFSSCPSAASSLESLESHNTCITMYFFGRRLYE